DLSQLIAEPQSRMRTVIEKYQGNRAGFGGFGRAAGGGRPRSKEYYQDWLAALEKLPFDALIHDDQINYLLLKNSIAYQLHRASSRTNTEEDVGLFVPFQQMIEKLNDAQNQEAREDAARVADFLQKLKLELDDAKKSATNQFEKTDATL